MSSNSIGYTSGLQITRSAYHDHQNGKIRNRFNVTPLNMTGRECDQIFSNFSSAVKKTVANLGKYLGRPFEIRGSLRDLTGEKVGLICEAFYQFAYATKRSEEIEADLILATPLAPQCEDPIIQKEYTDEAIAIQKLLINDSQTSFVKARKAYEDAVKNLHLEIRI